MAVKHHVDVFDSWDGDTLLDEEFRTRDDLFAKTSGPSLGVERWSTSSAADQSQRDSKYLRHPSEETKLSAPKKQLWQELISERHELEGLQEQRQDEHSFRVFFIKQGNSHSRLSITRDLFESICRLLEIFAKIKEFALSFGYKIRESDIGPPPCRFQIWRLSSQEEYGLYECAYGLRYVERTNSSDPADLWRVRQVAVYQKFAGSEAPETWIFISASQTMMKTVKKYLHNNLSPRLRSPFELHLAIITVALANWRWYIKSLVEQTEEQTSRVIGTNVAERPAASFMDGRIKFDDRQSLKVIEDHLLDMIIIFESILDTIVVLLRQWEKIKKQDDDHANPDTTTAHLEEFSHEVRLYRKKVKVLYERVKGSSALLSNMLEYENAKQAQANGESLKALAQESREENAAMKSLTEKSTKDAAAVKVITLITIVYLPTTVVAGFFSTQFVSQEQLGNGVTKLKVAGNWWIYAAVSVPLTIFTIFIWYAWVTYPWNEWRRVARKRFELHRAKDHRELVRHRSISLAASDSNRIVRRSRTPRELSEVEAHSHDMVVLQRSRDVTPIGEVLGPSRGKAPSKDLFRQHPSNETPPLDAFSFKNSFSA